MSKKMLPEAEQYVKHNYWRRIWRKIVRFMACIVVFCTTYALILPAITMEKECELEEHAHLESCYTKVEVSRDDTDTLTCTEQTEAHAHSNLCYGTWELVCELEEHVHDVQCTPLQGLGEEERAKVEHVIALIEALPTLDEVTAQADTMDLDSEEYQSWFNELSWNARIAYNSYEALSEELRLYVPDTTKMDDLAWTWQTAVQSNDTVASVDVYHINLTSNVSAIANLATIIYGGSASEVLGVNARSFEWWHAIVVDKKDDGFYVSDINREQPLDKRNIKPSTEEGFVLFVQHDRDALATVEVGQSVLITPSDFYKTDPKVSTTPVGMITFTKPKDNSGELKTVTGASTRDLITVNLFNYGANINEKWASDKNYPGFQSPEKSAIADASRMDFGNSIVKETGNPNVVGSTGSENTINGVNGSINYPVSGVINHELINGYPALKDGTSLAYLFSANTYATQANSQNIDGLFQYDEKTGKYYFDSRENNATFNAVNSTFTLYEQIVTPNFIIYPFGNFLPFNDIRTQTTQTTKIDQTWFQIVAASAQQKYNNGMGAEYQTLYNVLTTFDSNIMGGGSWNYHNAIQKYFTKQGLPTPPKDDERFSNMYTIDYDEPKDFFFGMSMHMDFMQPKDGLTGPDQKQPMEYTFAGDDDVWIYIDGKLFLDLSGVHRHVGGQIDFVNGEVRYYELLPSTGDVDTEPYKIVTFEEILGTTNGLNEKGAFEDYSSHTMDFYYMERGAGSSVCKMEFNLHLLRKNTISVTKEITTVDSNGNKVDTEVMGNPDYYFNIVNENNELFVGPGSVTGVTQYKIMDSGGNILKNADGTDKVFTTDAYGIFTLKIGQTAVFQGISEDKGEYFVQELIKEEDNTQYPTVNINDKETWGNKLIDWWYRKYFYTGTENEHTEVLIGPYGYKWYGRNGYNTDSSSASFYFTQQNQVDVSKLGSLSITKRLENDLSESVANKTFKMNVTLDSEPVPVGTTYTLTNADGSTVSPSPTVTTAGVIELKAGQTATLSNIISGTQFQISEDSDSAIGYFVGYKQENADEATETPEGVSGVIRVDTDVAVTVTNTENAVEISIPVTKQYYAYDMEERCSTFNLVQVEDANGKTVVESSNISSEKDGKITVVDTPVTVEDFFTLIYLSTDNITYDDNAKAVFYYRLTEDNTTRPNSTLKNYQVYVYEVTVTKTDNGMTAAITNMWTGTADEDGTPTGELAKLDNVTTATFTNTIVGPLTISKTVDGSPLFRENEYTFTITLDTSTAGNVPLANAYSGTCTTTADDETVTTESITLTFSGETETRKTGTVKIKHGQSITLTGIPYDTTWTVEEETPSGMKVTYVVYEGETPVDTDAATGQIKSDAANIASVAFTNTQLYELPQTGGAGITTYTIAGLMLMLFSMAYLLYRFSKL